jgi:hypothetical protein
MGDFNHIIIFGNNIEGATLEVWKKALDERTLVFVKVLAGSFRLIS